RCKDLPGERPVVGFDGKSIVRHEVHERLVGRRALVHVVVPFIEQQPRMPADESWLRDACVEARIANLLGERLRPETEEQKDDQSASQDLSFHFSLLAASSTAPQLPNWSARSAKDRSSVFARQLVFSPSMLPAATKACSISATHGSVSLCHRLGRTRWRELVKDRATLSP